MKTIFTAQIYDLKTRTTVSGDKTTMITLKQDNLSNEVLTALTVLLNSQANESREIAIGMSNGEE